MDNIQIAPASAQFWKLVEDEWEFSNAGKPFAGDDDGRPSLQRSPAQCVRIGCCTATGSMHEFGSGGRVMGRAALTSAEQLNYDIFVRLLDNEIRENRVSRLSNAPLQNRGFQHRSFPSCMPLCRSTRSRTYENYVVRLDLP